MDNETTFSIYCLNHSFSIFSGQAVGATVGRDVFVRLLDIHDLRCEQFG